MITNAGLNMIKNAKRGTVTDLEYKIIAVGSDNTPPAAGDVALGTETKRKLLTSKTDGGNGIVDIVAILQADEAVGQIEEVGIFAGAAAAVLTPDSGILVARFLYSKLKTNVESIQFNGQDIVAEA